MLIMRTYHVIYYNEEIRIRLTSQIRIRHFVNGSGSGLKPDSITINLLYPDIHSQKIPNPKKINIITTSEGNNKYEIIVK